MSIQPSPCKDMEHKPRVGTLCRRICIAKRRPVQAALRAYTNCAGGNQDYKTRRWGWMKRPVVVFDAYAKRIPG